MNSKKVKCEICGADFPSISALRYHSFSCKKEKEMIEKEYSSNIDLINSLASNYAK